MLLPYIAIYATLLPLLIGIVNFDRLTYVFKLLMFYLLLSFVSDQICLTYFVRHVNNMVIINSFILVEKIILLVLLFYWPNAKQKPKLLLLILSTLIIFWLYAAIWCRTDKGVLCIYAQMPLFSTITSSVIAIYAAYKLFVIVEEATEISKNAVFWAVTSIFVYSSITLIVVSTVYLMPKQAWVFYNISHIIFCLLLTKTFLVAGNISKIR